LYDGGERGACVVVENIWDTILGDGRADWEKLVRPWTTDSTTTCSQDNGHLAIVSQMFFHDDAGASFTRHTNRTEIAY